ncbi:MAG: hypothetical protein NTU54_06895 [Candidatus Omnitrophica bacterium]|nr:hypothetical protein [Candidatus Omnitrophota bacterium]
MRDIFYNRKLQLELLSKRIGALKDGYRQNLAILGDELVGKTSLVFKFLEGFYDSRTIAIYIEARPEGIANFARRFIGVLLYNFLSSSGIPLKEDLAYLLDKSEKYIPRTVRDARSILSSLTKRYKGAVFTELLSLCDAIHEETSKSCVVIFDEFHNLESLGIKDLYGQWSKLLIARKTTMYIIISSRRAKAKAILAKELSLLFGNFEVISVEPFDTGESEVYLKTRLGESGLNEPLRNFVVHFTGGYPFYLDIICAMLAKSGPESLSVILEELVFEPSGLLNQRFSNYLKQFLDSPYSQDYLSLLYMVSNGQNKINDLVHLLRRPKKEILTRINHLAETDTLNRSGDFLSINDRVFGFWLKFVHREKERSLTFDAKNQKSVFVACIEEMINEFMRDSQKCVTERVSELLRLFADDTILIEKKRLRLERFREVKLLNFPSKGLKDGLLGRSQDSVWIMAFKNDLITEDDIMDFSRECKKYRHKLQRKIIVSLKNIDANARLRAMDEKILTWDVGNLNRLLDIFSRPRIIV